MQLRMPMGLSDGGLLLVKASCLTVGWPAVDWAEPLEVVDDVDMAVQPFSKKSRQ